MQVFDNLKYTIFSLIFIINICIERKNIYTIKQLFRPTTLTSMSKTRNLLDKTKIK